MGFSRKINEMQAVPPIEYFDEINLPATNRTFPINIHGQRIGFLSLDMRLSLLVQNGGCVIASGDSILIDSASLN